MTNREKFNKEWNTRKNTDTTILMKDKHYTYYLRDLLAKKGILNCEPIDFIKTVIRNKFTDAQLETEYLYWLEDKAN